MQSTVANQSSNSTRVLGISLWIGQILLAVLFGMAGVMKSFLPIPALVTQGISYASDLPLWLLRLIGVAELSGAIGILLPALTRIQPRLTPLAALGFTAIQVLAICFHASRGELARALPLNLVLLSLSLFVLWGRGNRLPIRPRP
jgi:uncharacterized membrane protein YphA (DoxX/SURF4 family)